MIISLPINRLQEAAVPALAPLASTVCNNCWPLQWATDNFDNFWGSSGWQRVGRGAAQCWPRLSWLRLITMLNPYLFRDKGCNTGPSLAATGTWSHASKVWLLIIRGAESPVGPEDQQCRCRYGKKVAPQIVMTRRYLKPHCVRAAGNLGS